MPLLRIFKILYDSRYDSRCALVFPRYTPSLFFTPLPHAIYLTRYDSQCALVFPCYTPSLFFTPLPRARPGDAHADSVVVGITFVCVLLLFLITLMVTSCYFVLKNIAVKQYVSAVPT